MFFDALKREFEIRNFSQKTVKCYLYYNQDLIKHAKKDPRFINESDIREYLTYLFKERHVSGATARLALNALKFYYLNVQKRRFHYLFKGKLPKQPKRLPVVLSKEEVSRLLSSVSNPIHKLNLRWRILIWLIKFYGCGKAKGIKIGKPIFTINKLEFCLTRRQLKS